MRNFPRRVSNMQDSFGQWLKLRRQRPAAQIIAENGAHFTNGLGFCAEDLLYNFIRTQNNRLKWRQVERKEGAFFMRMKSRALIFVKGE